MRIGTFGGDCRKPNPLKVDLFLTIRFTIYIKCSANVLIFGVSLVHGPSGLLMDMIL